MDIDVVSQRDFLRVDAEDPRAAFHIRPIHDDPSIEPARAQQRRVEHVRAIGRRNQNDALVRFEPVHFDEQLVERLLPLVMPAPQAGAPMAADRIDLIDKHDTRRVLLPLLEEIAYARGADPDEHLDEI